MKLSPHFSLAEATISETAQKLGLSNQPLPAHLANMRIAAAGMEQVRALFERAVQVTSWYRSPAVNHAVGGVPTSHHALGWAIDFRVADVDGLTVARQIRDSAIRFDQLIWYRPSDIVHLSFQPSLRRRVQTNPTTNAGAKLIVGLAP